MGFGSRQLPAVETATPPSPWSNHERAGQFSIVMTHFRCLVCNHCINLQRVSIADLGWKAWDDDFVVALW